MFHQKNPIAPMHDLVWSVNHNVPPVDTRIAVCMVWYHEVYVSVMHNLIADKAGMKSIVLSLSLVSVYSWKHTIADICLDGRNK